MVKAACPGWASRTYHTFLAKHARGNPNRNTELFIRVGRGLYTIVPAGSLRELKAGSSDKGLDQA